MMTHLNELRGLADRYQAILRYGLPLTFPGNWRECLEKVRRCPQCEERYGLEILQPSICDLQVWSALGRFIWLCDKIFRAECEGLARKVTTWGKDAKRKETA